MDVSLLCCDLTDRGVGRRAATRMPATAFEHHVNVTRGYATLVITLWSIAIVLEEPACLAFWLKHAYALNAAPTGWFGLGCSALFLAYLVIDTAIGILCRHRFRRSMGAVFLHHGAVGIAVAAFMLPSPPRARDCSSARLPRSSVLRDSSAVRGIERRRVGRCANEPSRLSTRARPPAAGAGAGAACWNCAAAFSAAAFFSAAACSAAAFFSAAACSAAAFSAAAFSAAASSSDSG